MFERRGHLSANGARPRGDAATCERLLQAARAVFARRGCNDATVDDIIQEAGVSRGTFYIYFKNKLGVFEELITRVIGDLFERAAARYRSGNVFGNLEAGNRLFLEVWKRDGDLMRNLVQLATINPHFAEIHNQMRQQFIARIQRSIERHQSEGITYAVDPAIAAAAMAGMVESFAIRHFTYGEPAGVQVDVATLSYQLTSLWYRAVYNDRAPDVPPWAEYIAPIDSLEPVMHFGQQRGGAAEGEAGEGDEVEAGEGGVQALVVAHQPAEAALPGERALHHPAAGE